jgi:hypothetical protein
MPIFGSGFIWSRAARSFSFSFDVACRREYRSSFLFFDTELGACGWAVLVARDSFSVLAVSLASRTAGETCALSCLACSISKPAMAMGQVFADRCVYPSAKAGGQNSGFPNEENYDGGPAHHSHANERGRARSCGRPIIMAASCDRKPYIRLLR